MPRRLSGNRSKQPRNDPSRASSGRTHATNRIPRFLRIPCLVVLFEGRILRGGHPTELGSLGSCSGVGMAARIRPLDRDQRPPVALPSEGTPPHGGSKGSDLRPENPQPAHVALRTFA